MRTDEMPTHASQASVRVHARADTGDHRKPMDTVKPSKRTAWAPPPHDPQATHPTEKVADPCGPGSTVPLPLPVLFDAAVEETPQVGGARHRAPGAARWPLLSLPVVVAGAIAFAVIAGLWVMVAGAHGPALPDAPPVERPFAPTTGSAAASVRGVVLPSVSPSVTPFRAARPVRSQPAASSRPAVPAGVAPTTWSAAAVVTPSSAEASSGSAAPTDSSSATADPTQSPTSPTVSAPPAPS